MAIEWDHTGRYVGKTSPTAPKLMTQHEALNAAAGVRPESPIEYELRELREQLARLETKQQQLFSRLTVICAPSTPMEAKDSRAAPSCEVGRQISAATSAVVSMCDDIDACMACLQI